MVEADARLPRGRHGLSAGTVAADQGRRLCAAARELFAEGGFALTSRQVVSRAHVSSGAFYAHFDDLDDILGAAFEEQADLLLEALGRSSIEGGPLIASAGFLAADPSGRTLFGPAAALGFPAIRAPHARLLERLGAARIPKPSRPGVGFLFAAASLALLVGSDDPPSLAVQLEDLAAFLAIP